MSDEKTMARVEKIMEWVETKPGEDGVVRTQLPNPLLERLREIQEAGGKPDVAIGIPVRDGDTQKALVTVCVTWPEPKNGDPK